MQADLQAKAEAERAEETEDDDPDAEPRPLIVPQVDRAAVLAEVAATRLRKGDVSKGWAIVNVPLGDEAGADMVRAGLESMCVLVLVLVRERGRESG